MILWSQLFKCQIFTLSFLILITMWSSELVIRPFKNLTWATHFRSHVILWFCYHSFLSVKVLTVSSLTLITLWSCDLVIKPFRNFRRATLFRQLFKNQSFKSKFFDFDHFVIMLSCDHSFQKFQDGSTF